MGRVVTKAVVGVPRNNCGLRVRQAGEISLRYDSERCNHSVPAS